MSSAAPLVCPKCSGQMRSYERNGVLVDQCTVCHGIFLDRGELDHLITAEANYHKAELKQSGYSDRSDHHEKRSDHYEKPYKKKRKRSFLEELFD